MKLSWKLNIFLVSSMVVTCVSSAPVEEGEKDKIESLPGLNYPINFAHYSGYLDGTDSDHLHYWFIESQRDPLTDPLLLWMNGGPGCSSLLGLLTELGPFRFKDDGTGLKDNPYSWNKVANIIYLEAPICVGFSYSDKNANCTTGDVETAASNYKALQHFFKKFPKYRNHDFYITGESYAGIYIPTLSVLVLEGNDVFPINFKGYAIGNGIYSYKTNINSLMFYGYNHGLLGQALWHELIRNCCSDGISDQENCHFEQSLNTNCQKAVMRAAQIIFNGGINPYDIYGMCWHQDATESRQYHSNRLSTHFYHMFSTLIREDVRSDFCGMRLDSMRIYLNDAATRKALHIPLHVTQEWGLCSRLNYSRHYENVYPQLTYLQTKVRALIYNGDCDAVCNVISNTWDIDQLNLQVVEGHKKWIESEKLQVGGYVKRFVNLDFVTVRGAGHMVPETRPSQSLQMITAFLEKKPYSFY